MGIYTIINSMRDPFNESEFHLSTYNLDNRRSEGSKDESEGDRGETEEPPESTETEIQEEPVQNIDIEVDMDQLPDELRESMESHIEIFSDSGVTVVGLGRMDLEIEPDEEDIKDVDEIDISMEDVNIVEMFCEVGETRFVYSFLPNQSYNGIEIQYNVLQELFLLSDVEALEDVENTERIQIVNLLEDILSQKDLGAVLRSNRTIERTDLVAWINIVRSQNADFIHVLDYTPEGEVVGSRIEKRVYVPQDQIEREKCLHKAVQEITNISRSYSGLLGLAYLENGVRVPDSIAEKVRAAIDEEDWKTYTPTNTQEDVRGFQ